jgi:transposase-like protein
MTRKKGSRDYPEWMKREAIRLHEEEGCTSAEILERFSIYDHNRISAWVRQYRAEGEEMFANKRSRSGRKPGKESADKYIARIEMENDLLKKFHTELRKEQLVKRDIGQSDISKKDTL